MTFDMVVNMLAKKGIPRSDAISICRRNLKDGMKMWHRINNWDKTIGRGQRELFSSGRCADMKIY